MKWYILITVIVLAIIVYLFAWRREANSQELEDINSIPYQMMQVAVENLQEYGVGAEFEPVGVVSNAFETSGLLTQAPEFFIKINKGSTRAITIQELYKYSYLNSANAKLMRSDFERMVRTGDYIYKMNVSGSETHITISPGGERFSGLLAVATRLPARSFAPQKPSDLLQRCTKKVITTNIFGNPAETVRICANATCMQTTPENCLMSEITSRHGVFGYVTPTPNIAPREGMIVGKLCRATASYEWGLKLAGGIKLGILGDYGIDVSGIGGTGTIHSDVWCQGG